MHFDAGGILNTTQARHMAASQLYRTHRPPRRPKERYERKYHGRKSVHSSYDPTLSEAMNMTEESTITLTDDSKDAGREAPTEQELLVDIIKRSLMLNDKEVSKLNDQEGTCERTGRKKLPGRSVLERMSPTPSMRPACIVEEEEDGDAGEGCVETREFVSVPRVDEDQGDMKVHLESVFVVAVY